jgi:hypothetical protein
MVKVAGLAVLFALAFIIYVATPAHSIPNPCQFCPFCSHCDKCDDTCPSCSPEEVKECSLCKYCPYCSLCSLCSTVCKEGAFIQNAHSIMGRMLPRVGVESWPDFNRVKNDIASLPEEYTQEYHAKKPELKAKVKAAKKREKEVLSRTWNPLQNEPKKTKSKTKKTVTPSPSAVSKDEL